MNLFRDAMTWYWRQGGWWRAVPALILLGALWALVLAAVYGQLAN